MLRRHGPTLILTLLALGLIWSETLVPSPPPQKIRELIAPPQYIKHVAFGYHESMADSLWLRSIQDFDQCGDGGLWRDRLIKVSANESRYDDAVCDKGWLYQMLASIITLAPEFRSAYLHGATVLSVLVNDHQGAKLIFDEGVKHFPKDGMLAYRAAYHYMHELKDPKRASELLVMAGNNGAPQWVFALAARLAHQSGQLEFAREVLLSTLQSYKDENPSYIKRLKDRLDKVEAELAALKNSPVKSTK